MASNFTMLEPNNFGGKLAQGINQGLNAGLTSGLQQLANQKLERMQQKAAQHSILSAFPDIPKEALSYVATLPAKEQLKILELLGNQRQQEHDQMMAQAQQPQIQPETNEMVQDESYANDLEKALSMPQIVQQLSPEQIQDATSQLEQLRQKLGANPVGVNPFPQEQTQPNQMAQPVTQPKAGGIPLAALAKGSKDALAQEKQDLAREKFEFEKQQAKGKNQEKTVAEEKLESEVTGGYETLKNLHKIAKRMMSDLDSGEIEVGPLASLKSKVAPTWLKDISGEFNKDSNRIVNLEAGGLRGAMSKYRVQKVEAAKPSLDQSIKVNKTILKDIIEETEDKLERMKEDYPDITQKVERASKKSERRREEAKAAEDNPLEYPTYYEENTQYEDDDGEKFILKNGEWRPM
jgi:hypothetical protein